MEQVKTLGDYLGETLHELLDPHPHVGDVRGKGLMWGVSVPFISNEISIQGSCFISCPLTNSHLFLFFRLNSSNPSMTSRLSHAVRMWR